eukprot:COSAG01_NODE_13116_length_1633_cov_1.769883_1_plen_89_part_10
MTLTLAVITCTCANQDQIVAYINAHENELNATVRYGTLDHYLDIVHHGTQIGDAGGDAGGDSAYVHERLDKELERLGALLDGQLSHLRA